VSGEGASKMIKAIGGHPTFIPAVETYTGLEKGIVDAAIAGVEWGKRYRFYEIVPQVIELNIFFGQGFINVSLSALRKMSEADRKVFLEVGRRVSIEYGDAMKKERENDMKVMAEKGMKVLPFPTAEREKWANLPEVKSLCKIWLDQQNAARRAGTEVMKTALDVFGVPEWMPK
jgi:TRAP-type C4-dicarboxylate transport system substrate-binding protein